MDSEQLSTAMHELFYEQAYKYPVDGSEVRRNLQEAMKLVAASNKALLLRVREGLPKLITDDPLGNDSFIEGSNAMLSQALAVIDAEIEGL